MGQIYVVTSGKGGVGKTTTVANIGSALAMAGQRVVLVDADIGLRNLDVVMGLESRIVYDIVDVVEGVCRLKQALVRDKRFEGLMLLPAAQTKDKSAVSIKAMRTICNELRTEADFVLIDCPAGIEQGFKVATAAADGAIIVCTPDVSSIRDADRVIGLLQAQAYERVKHGQPEAPALAEPLLVINRLRPSMVKRGDMMTQDDIQEILALPILGVIPEDEGIIVTTNRGEPAVMVQSSLAGAAYRDIARRLMGEDVPLMRLQDRGGIFARLRKIVGGR
jgi:septum site-determining protein MinD